MRLRYGVIGAGVVAPLHLEAIAALDDVELVGISSLEAEHLDVRGLLSARSSRTSSSFAHRTRRTRR